MKKRSKTSSVIVAAAVAGLPLVGAPELQAQRPSVEKPVTDPRLVKTPALVLKYAGRFEKTAPWLGIVGIDNGRPIYQNARNEQFYLEPATGDMILLEAKAYEGFREATRGVRAGAPLRMVKWSASKFPGEVTILGVDEAGHTIHQNARGEKFYLDPATGDMVFVK